MSQSLAKSDSRSRLFKPFACVAVSRSTSRLHQNPTAVTETSQHVASAAAEVPFDYNGTLSLVRSLLSDVGLDVSQIIIRCRCANNSGHYLVFSSCRQFLHAQPVPRQAATHYTDHLPCIQTSRGLHPRAWGRMTAPYTTPWPASRTCCCSAVNSGIASDFLMLRLYHSAVA
jgi:hypothetical protein